MKSKKAKPFNTFMPVINVVKDKQTVVCRLPSLYLLLANSVNDGLGAKETAAKQPENYGNTNRY